MALVRRVLMQLLLVAPSSCLRVPTVSRREAVRLAAASATTIPLVANAVPQYVVPIQDDLKILIIKAKELRTAVRNGASARRSLPLDPTPGVNNYEALTNKVLRAKVATLEPLRAQFKAVAADAGAKSLLAPEIQKAFELQPLLMQGHMLELDQVCKQSMASLTPPLSSRPSRQLGSLLHVASSRLFLCHDRRSRRPSSRHTSASVQARPTRAARSSASWRRSRRRATTSSPSRWAACPRPARMTTEILLQVSM
jgi:hypothetical protein